VWRPTRPITPASASTAGPRPLVEVVNLGSGTELTPGPDEPEINSRMMLPLPDDTAAAVAADRLHNLDVPGAGLGNLAKLVGFVAGTQGTGTPSPYQAPRLILLHGAHEGGVAAGEPARLWQDEVDRATAGAGALGLLAATAGVPIQVVDVTAEPAAAIETGDAADLEHIEIGLRQGWRLAEGAVDGGTDLIILAAAGAGQVAAAAAVVAATVAVEPAAVLPRVVRAGHIDDQAWMVRCLAVRDALRRERGRLQGSKEVLVALGGYDLAVATGIVLGATFRRTAVMVDGPVGVAAGMLARDGRHPTVAPAAKVLGTSPLVDLRLDLGEGAAALAALPLVQNALRLATLPIGGEAVVASPAGSAGATGTDEPDEETDPGETAEAGSADQPAADALAQSSPS
jgi:NaMN:DMB phosphoribosyltransferase